MRHASHLVDRRIPRPRWHASPTFAEAEFGAHLHTQPHNWREKIEAAWDNGCRRFDGAMRGFGGCPMAKDELTGNMATENLVFFFDEIGADPAIQRPAFGKSMAMALDVFPKSH